MRRLLITLLAVTMTVTPRFQFAPGTVRVKMALEPAADHRAYCIEWLGPNAGRSCRQMEGLASPHTIWMTLPNLPAGYYEVWGEVFGNGRQENSPHVTFEVVEPGGVAG